MSRIEIEMGRKNRIGKKADFRMGVLTRENWVKVAC